MDAPRQPGSSSISRWPEPAATVISQDNVKVQDAQITPPPELRLRAPIPVPQDDQSCQQALQSASQVAQQASDSVRQISQQASQSVDAASRSASAAIQQAQQSASSSISVASRSAASAVSSASSLIASIQSSASDAISRANGAQVSAQAVASIAQASAVNAEASASNAQADASKAVLQAGAAVAAATGQAAAAGSSFLAAAALATQSAQASVSALGSAAASQIAEANIQASNSKTNATTATETAIAIVGSIIASALITILIYFLIIRHRKQAKQRARNEKMSSPRSSPRPDAAYPADPKFPVSAQMATTAAGSQQPSTSQSALDPARATLDPGRATGSSQASFSLFPKQAAGDNPNSGLGPSIKRTSVAWNPSKPPKPPTLGSWLLTQQDISPFGPIQLATAVNVAGPLGGQLKSPLQSKTVKPADPKPAATAAMPPLKILDLDAPLNPVPPQTQAPIPKTKPASPVRESKMTDFAYRSSKASSYTDEVPESTGSPIRISIPATNKDGAAKSTTMTLPMQLPSPKQPVRSTAQWLLDQQAVRPSPRNSEMEQRPAFAMGGGLPRNPRAARGSGLQADVRAGMGSAMSNRSRSSTPGVGKAM